MELARSGGVLAEVRLTQMLARPVEGLLAWMRPRDVREAGRTVSALCAVAILVTIVTELMGANADTPMNGWALALAGVSLLLAAMVSAAAWFFDEGTSLAWALSPFVAILVIVLVDVATHDATITALVFFFFPTVYAATQLPRPGAVLVTGASLAGALVVLYSQLPVRSASVEACYIASVVVTTAVMLTRSTGRQHELVAELGRLATVDPLTGLVTRRGFDVAMAANLKHLEGEEGTSLLILDVDRFKDVNDRFGHPGGDRVLVRLSELLVQASRRGDVVCRLGGDEIAMMLPRCTMEVAVRRAEEIVQLVRATPFEVSADESIQVSISAGLAHAPTHGTEPRSLYVAADAALYEAKRRGRDRVVAWLDAA